MDQMCHGFGESFVIQALEKLMDEFYRTHRVPAYGIVFRVRISGSVLTVRY